MSADIVRDLVRQATVGTLATLDVATGHPFASLVEVATLPEGQPILLLSGLARHTRNLVADPRASLLVDQRENSSTSLTTARATIVGTIGTIADDAVARRRYLARHPAASGYVDFGDFAFRVLEPDICHLVAGFGRIQEMAGSALLLKGPPQKELASQEAQLLVTVNSRLGSADGGDREVRVAGIDLEGVDVDSQGRMLRLPLDVGGVSPDRLANTIVCAVRLACESGHDLDPSDPGRHGT